jgi:uncharacterized protein
MVYRNLYHDIKDNHLESEDIVVITGMRRTGKTTILRQLHDHLSPTNPKLLIDLENALERKRFENPDYNQIAQELFPGIHKKQPEQPHTHYLFLDEIQHAPQIPSLVKYFHDHYPIKCILTGSASFYLKNLFSESLAGRKQLFELYPLSFPEYLEFKGVNLKIPAPNTPISSALYLQIQNHYQDYVIHGGFPQVVLAKDSTKKKAILEEIFNAYYQMEVLGLSDFKKNSAIRDLMLLLIERAGSLLDIQKLSSQLGINRHTLTQYLEFLQGTYFIHQVSPYSRNLDVALRKNPKIYICDTGFITHLSKLEKGHLIENAAYNQLKTKGEINFYRQKDGQEIDLVLDKSHAYEVKRYATQTDLNKLNQLSAKLNLTPHLATYEQSPHTPTHCFQL